MTVEDTPNGFRYEFVVLILPLIVAMTQPAIQRSALSIFSTNDAAAVCAGRRCQASNDQNVLLLHELTAGAPVTRHPATLHTNGPRVALNTPAFAQIPSVNSRLDLISDPWGHFRLVLCAFVRGTIHEAYFFLSGISGVSTPTHLDLKLIGAINPHADRTSECPAAPKEPASTPRVGPWKG